ncbi:MAG: ASKHA domain-containing protein [Desulfobacterales bacterium]
MKTYSVLFLPYERKIEVPEGETLLRAALEAGAHINASCGGGGICGKCRVIIEKGKVEGGVTEKLSPEDREKGYRLACQSKIVEDVIVRVPMESAIDSSIMHMAATARKTAHITEMDLNELKEQGLFMPPVEKRYLELPPPDQNDHLPDVTRLVSFLQLRHGEHRMFVGLPVIRKIPDTIRKENFKMTATLARPVQKGRKTHIINIQHGDTSGHNYAIAVDVGTTTVYAQLLDLTTDKPLAQFGEFNGQISYGEDVISRIIYAEKPGGLEKLHQVIINTINSLIKKLIRKSGIDIDEVSAITLAGNTTMTQLLLKINPAYIRRSPYVPAATLFPPINAASLGLELEDHVTALVYPAISSYVGGDIVAGVMGSGLYRSKELTLFLDIGTNAEIVVGNKDWLACAACSAGPAFEGGGIKFGMRAAKGAIEDFSIDPVSLEPMNATIGNAPPKGISGSGLISIVATLFELGIINSKGKFNQDLKTQRIREVDGIFEYVLAYKDVTAIDRDIVLTEIDIDNLIRAKGAIYSGFMTLLSEVGLSVTDLDRVILSGGFGSYVDLEKAITIGLLPEIEAEKVTFVGNGSLMGAKMSSLSNHIRKDVVEVTRKMTNFELSETTSYMDHYVAALFLPHTDINLFPKLRQRLKGRRLIQ